MGTMRVTAMSLAYQEGGWPQTRGILSVPRGLSTCLRPVSQRPLQKPDTARLSSAERVSRQHRLTGTRKGSRSGLRTGVSFPASQNPESLSN